MSRASGRHINVDVDRGAAMSPGATAERVYREIRKRLVDGRWPTGAHLEPALLGEELFASVTPIRDALHRLAGERLVERPSHNGFRVPVFTEAALRDLYQWRGRLLALALRLRKSVHPIQASETTADRAAEASLLLVIARLAASPAHEDAVALVNDRLGQFHRAECHLLPDREADLAEAHAALHNGDWRRLGACLNRHARRRIGVVAQIIIWTGATV